MSALPAIAIVLIVTTSDNPLLALLGFWAALVVSILLMDWMDSKLP